LWWLSSTAGLRSGETRPDRGRTTDCPEVDHSSGRERVFIRVARRACRLSSSKPFGFGPGVIATT
jgi:hypothetical protein